MGRRKERRAAASMASSRRMKLDLFAEPSGENKIDVGDMVDENNNIKEIEEEGEGTAKIPNSKPTTSPSGKRQDNPLLLLGQYSDEEANEEEVHLSAQAEELVKASGDREDDTAEAFAIENIKQEELDKEFAQSNAPKNLEDSRDEGAGIVPLNESEKGEEPIALLADTWTYGMQNTGEVAFGWKLVMHEETNQYYYWNIETGETSWEVPAIFAQGAELGTAPKVVPVHEQMESTPLNNDAFYTLHGESVGYPSLSAGDHCNGAHLISNDEEKYKVVDEVTIQSEGYTNENVVYPEFGSGIHQTGLKMARNGIFSSESIDAHPLTTNLHHETDYAVSTRVVSYAESLLQRLTDVNRSGTQVQGCNWVSKYILEIEIRLSDFRSLLVYGSSLLPFWMHSEEKLKGIEHAINDHLSHFTNSAQTGEIDVGVVSVHRDETISGLGIKGNAELSAGDEPVVVAVQNPCSSPNDASTAQKEAVDVSIPLKDVNIDGKIDKISKTLLPERVDHQSSPPAIEDEDMDVDMELDEEITTNDQTSGDTSVAKCRSPAENFIQPVPPGEWPTSILEKECDVPPPPDEDWIPPPPPDAEPVPPPPPDTEPIPPPPPDDPLAPTYAPHPPYTETVPPFPYTEQYNASYSASASEYYGPMMAGIPSSNYNASSEESQAVVSQSCQYFGTVPTPYSEATSLVVDPMEPSAYYSIPNGTVPLLPAVSSFESSYVYNASDPVSYHDTTTDQAATLNALPEPDNISISNLKGELDAHAVFQETEMLAAQVPSIPTTVQVAASVAEIMSSQVPSILTSVQAATTAAPLTSTPAASSAAVPSTTAPKAPNKVLRSKKRTIAAAPSLRSNKRVSSLVDKWKAAKEELHEDEEEEPDNAYEFLERKRQREIEQWRARQIATGEAKENANFQPLGGDWRERVKRRRSQSSKESVRSPSDAPFDGKKPPDLTELSRDLPNGWLVYWDESSNKPYYGNTSTMETSWTKPTQ